MILTPPPFRVTVFDGTFRRRGWIGDPLSVHATPRHNAMSVAEVTVAADHPRVRDLITPGCRLVLEYRGGFLMSGPVTKIVGTGPRITSTVTVTVEDDFRVLSRILGWPNPTGGIMNQGAATAYDRRKGPAETVVKWFVARNAARLGLPITAAPDLRRGDVVDVQMRMHPLTDRLFPAVDLAGIGVTVRQEGAGLVVDCYKPEPFPRTLSEDSGALVAWEWSTTAPGATRAVVGGAGEGTAREFVQVVDADLEAQWHDVAEVFQDARDVGGETTDDSGATVTPTAAEVAAALQERGVERLGEGRPVSGLSLTLAEAEGLRYGQHVNVGDSVTVEAAPGVPVTEVLREVSISWTADSGLDVTPVIGSRTDDPDVALRRAVNELARSLRALRVR